MTIFRRWARSAAARFAFAVALVFAVPGAASAATYIDTTLSQLAPENRVKIAQPRPVQVLFQFKSKGLPNGRATAMLKQQVIDALIGSDLFSQVVETPVEGGAVLNVVIDNVVPDGAMKDATAQGFATGLTFGLKGTLVTDNYICTVEYLSGPGAAPITRTAKHALHTTIGLKSAPPNGEKAPNIKIAVETMTRQVVGYAVNDLAGDPAFAPGAATAVAAPAEVPAVPAEAATLATPAEPAAAPTPAGGEG
ncbi:hypothetical protein [Caulobacter sp. 17J65-9]|uniref:hypothetical protein n=1 Tax=Caulobacter sp. 17J65-9 TaxID=2709382 RepID=UPI0013CB9722|nr:hypothetical protein [Caulobacter sp. 17J65-9]NEX94839.1 hypothetical protein [Caulobacter sp. 17J65-9]